MAKYFIPYPNGTESETNWTRQFLEDCERQGGKMRVLSERGDGIHFTLERVWLKKQHKYWSISLFGLSNKKPRGYFVEESDDPIPAELFEI